MTDYKTKKISQDIKSSGPQKSSIFAEIGLKCGVEIHQQLDTHKLFCKCPSELRLDNPDIIAKRRLYAVAGETGKIDIAAAYEESKKREYIYEAYSDTTCEIELDESPPRYVNHEALRIALQIAFLLNAKPLNVTQVMRKTVINGSNTSGFQRTMLIARNGYLTINNKKIRIESIGLEEDAARRVAETKNSVTFRLDRLGIPLVEIATSPDIANPEEAKIVALKIGEILRACKVKRGLGTIRQDVNLSITGGARTEIKGVQEPGLIAKTIEKDIERQLSMIEKNEKIEKTVRNALPDGNSKFLRPLPGEARMYPETDLPLVKITEKELEEIKNNLPELKESIVARIEEKIKNSEIIKELISENKVELFEELSKIANPEIVAKTITLTIKSIEAHEKISTEKITKTVLEQIFNALNEKRIIESSIEFILTEICKGESIDNALAKFKLVEINQEDIEKEIQNIINSNKGAPFNALMGHAMAKLKGKADGKKIAEILKKLTK